MHLDNVVIQIGAHVGDTVNDPIFRHIDAATNLICFEPVPYLFDQLKRNYGRAFPDNHFRFVNQAVSNVRTTLEMTVVAESNNFSELPDWASQLSSFDSCHARAHLPSIKTELIPVQVTTLNDILTDHQIASIDLLQVDTEGHDFEILMGYDFRIRPRQIVFEHRHMDGTDKVGERFQTLSQRLEKIGYALRVDSEDTLCVFDSLSHVVRTSRTMVSRARLSHLAKYVQANRDSNAALVECGVAKGGCLAIMKYFAGAQNPIFGFDSFEGMPTLTPEDENDAFAAQWVGHNCSGGMTSIRETFRDLNLNFRNVYVVKGYFEETLPFYVDNIEHIAILRLDTDWYAATKYCLEMLYPKVVEGGVVLIDDYGTFPGCRNAVDEYRIEQGITQPLLEFEKGSEWYWTR